MEIFWKSVRKLIFSLKFGRWVTLSYGLLNRNTLSANAFADRVSKLVITQTEGQFPYLVTDSRTPAKTRSPAKDRTLAFANVGSY